MFGFVFGTACLIGLIAVVSRGRRRWHGYYRAYGRGPLYAVLARLNATPGQEKVIGQAVEEFWEVARKGRDAMKSSREAAARAVRGPSFDESSLRGAFLEQDQTLSQIREAALEAGRKIHEVLDERQRKALGELIESGFGWGHHHHGHHRGYGCQPAYC
jgi:hypothetical protein